MGRKLWTLVGMLIMLVLLLSVYTLRNSNSVTPSPLMLNNSAYVRQQPANTSQVIIAHQQATLSPQPTSTGVLPTPTDIPATPTDIPVTGTSSGTSPYGSPPPVSAEEAQLTRQLFALINSDRAGRGLYPYTWNATLADGARLHSWNMVHCGFNHTCPDGHSPCQRIRAEGFVNCTDCGENIGYAGPYPTPWGGVHTIQESMANEPPTGWHRIYLFSKTIHSIGVGIYVDPSGYIWFTEDLVS